MGPEIIPAVLVKSEREFRQKIESLEDLVDVVQIDVMDGKFVPNTTFADPVFIKGMGMPMEFEVHLMVEDPLEHLDGWSAADCARVLIHAESVKDLSGALEAVKSYGMEAGISINPETPISAIKDAVDDADVVQIMGVNPGFMGQEYNANTLSKVVELRGLYPDLLIEVDGGVSDVNARELAEAGVDRLVSGSYISSTGAPAKMIAKLEDLTDIDE